MGAVLVTAVAVTAVAVLLAGCGAGAARPPGRGRLVPAGTATSTAPAGSRAEALALARRLLTRLVLPAGARPVRLPVPPVLRQPQIPSGGAHQVDVHRLFWLRQSTVAAQSFLEAHLPGGTRLAGYGGPGTLGVVSVSFTPRSTPAGIYGAELDTAVVTGGYRGSLLRADAEAIWYPPRTAAEHLDAARFHAVKISGTLLNPKLHTVTRTFTSSAVIGRLAGLLNGLPAAPYQPAGCPAIAATFQFSFTPATPAAHQVTVTPSGCMTVEITVSGMVQPPLWDSQKLTTAAMRLLGLRSLVSRSARAARVAGMRVAPRRGALAVFGRLRPTAQRS
jgi:hypothetical protein